MINRILSLLLALVCVMGVLPLSAFAAGGLSSAPASITQKSSAYMTIGGRSVRYKAASSVINNVGLPYVFDEQVDVPGFGPTRALCAYQKGTLGPGANGQKWNFKEEVNSTSLRVLLTYVYSHTYGTFTDAGNARGLEHWNQYWSDIWYMVAQAMSWYYEHGIIKDITSDREGFKEQCAEEFIAAMRLYHDTYGQSSWIKDWDKIGTHSIIDSTDGGKTGYSAYDYISTGVDLVLDHPEYYYSYHLWIYEWDKSQPWKLPGQSGVPMQRLLIAVPDDKPTEGTVSLTVKKLEAGTNKPIPNVTFKVESADGSGDFSVTKVTGADGTFTLTAEADGLAAGQFKISEEAVPDGYVAQTTSQIVTVMPNGSANSVFTFYNEPEGSGALGSGTGSIRKVDADNPTVGIPGAVIRITSVKLDDGGSFFGEYTTKDGGYISKEDLDFSNLPLGSFLAEEITPPEGFILSSDVSKVKQPFVWDGEHDVSLVFENSSKVKVQLKKVDESNSPLPGAVFLILRDGQIIGTEETQADGTITVSNVTEGHYEFVEVAAPEGMDCDKTPLGVYVDAEDFQGEQTIVVTKMNHHKRSLTIQKRDAESGDPIPNTSFHIRGVNIGYENDVVTGADGKAVLEAMPSGCFEIEETNVPAPWILDTNNRKTVWVDASKDQDVVVDFVNSTRPGIRLLKVDGQTGEPIEGAIFKIEEVDGGFTDQRQTAPDGTIFWEGLRPGAFKIFEVTPAPNYVHDDTVHIVQLEPNHTTTIELTNLVKPTLKILKVDSITKNPVAQAQFRIWRASGDTKTGEYNDLGTFYSNEAGEIVLEHTDPGWFKISELEAPSGYSIKQADHEFYLAAGQTKTVTVENIPLSALVVWKYDSVTGQPVEGAVFQVKYLSGTSGTGGTVIGTYRTSANGSFTVTGLQAGAYVVEELASDSSHVIETPPQTVYISGKQQDVVELYFGNSPKGCVLIKKIDSITHEPLSDVEFLVTKADGTLLGNANGKYVSDSAGTVLIDNIDPGETLIVKETRAKPGYVLDDTPQTVKVKAGETVTLEFRNQPMASLLIVKKDAVTGKPLSDVEFLLTDSAGGVIGSSNGKFVTDSAGTIRVDGLTPGMTVIAKETRQRPNYVLDDTPQTVKIKAGETVTLEFRNQPAGKLIVLKKDSLTGKPLEGATFKITTATGEFVPDENGVLSSNGIYYSDREGKITINGVVGSLVVTETASIPGYSIDEATRTQTVVVNPNDTQTLTFYNTPSTTLVIEKYIEGTTTPIKGVTFLVTDSSGAVIGNSNGEFITDEAGRIVLEGLEPGSTITAKEIKTVEGAVLDTTPKSIKIKAGEVQYLRFYNKMQGTIVVKKLDKLTGEPLAGVEFQITYSDGSYLDDDYGHLSSKGLYKTGPTGEIRINGVVGTLVISEVTPLPGYVMDEGTRTQTVKVNPGDTQTVVFYNTPIGNFELIKVVEGNESKRIPNVTFEIRRVSDDALVDTITTGSDGRATLQLEEGNYYAVETECPKEFKLDTTPHNFTMRDGKTTTLTVKNKPFSGILIHKTDSVTGKGIYGVTFLLYDSTNKPIGQYTSDDRGYVYVEGLADGGRYYLRELENEGYVPDTQMKTVYVKAGETTLVEWKNTPITAQIQITKKSVDYNPTNGLPAGALLEGAVFEIRDKAGNLVDTIRSDSRGIATSKPLPLSRYTIREVKAPANYGVGDQELTAYLEHAGQIVRFEVTNKALSTGVSITKTGPKQIMAGQPVRYVFSDIANRSNVMLTSFYWRDTLPAEVRLDTVVTGTYNFPGTYKITYRVNGGEPRTLADNLSTSKNYTLSASATALGLASNERVTEVMFVFGQAPGGFAQVEKPMLYCTAVKSIASTSFVNVADVGGVHNGIWVQAVSRWVTSVYGKPIVPSLPKTGY